MCYERREHNIARECWERDQGGKVMERLTRPGVHVDESAAKCIGNETKIQYASDRLLELILNGPTLMAFNKDKLRHMMRQLYARLEQYENTGVTPEEIVHIKTGIERVWKLMQDIDEEKLMQDIDEEKLKHLEELVDAENEGRLVVLPCKVGDTVYRTFAPNGREPVISAHTLMSVCYIVQWIDKFGKTVFLTREEAEAALAADKMTAAKKVNDLYDEEGGEILNE